jgi:hypothetical protein
VLFGRGVASRVPSRPCRLAAQSDKRALLDLQIDLLVEKEMTTVLQLPRDITRHFDVRPSVTAEQIRELAGQTDIQRVTDRIDAPDDDAPEWRR